MGGKMGIHDHWKAPHLSPNEHTKEENEGFLVLGANLRESFQHYHMASGRMMMGVQWPLLTFVPRPPERLE